MLPRTALYLPRFFNTLVPSRKLLTESNKPTSIATYIEQLQSMSVAPLTKLDLSGYRSKITMETYCIPDSPFTKALSKCPEVQHVDISGHQHIENLEFSRFRKSLPKLKAVTLKGISPLHFRIDTNQLVKYYAKNILLLADQKLMRLITKASCDYLIENKQEKYARSILSGITIDNLDPKPFQEALVTEELRTEELSRLEELASAKRREKRAMLKLNLLTDYKSGYGFDLNSPWYKMGPKSEEDLVECGCPHTVFVLYVVITKLKLWDIVLKGPGELGFMFSSPESLQAVYRHPAVQSAEDCDGHSGASFAMCMRFIEMMAKDIMAKEHTASFSSERPRSKL
ncbi:MAG: hypothetical protein NTW94_00440 [Legionellales bacterium]|nr:hypothetical protein [Legionellales bacterium]